MSNWKHFLDPDAHSGRFLPWKEVARATGLSRTTAWRLQKRHEFPAPYAISPGRVGYRESEVEAWKASRHHPELARPSPPRATPTPPVRAPVRPDPSVLTAPGHEAGETPQDLRARAAAPSMTSKRVHRAPRRKAHARTADQMRFDF